MTEPRTGAALDRRHVLAAGLGAAGIVGIAGLAACGDGTSTSNDDPIYGGGGGAPETSAATASSEATPSDAAAGTSAGGATPIIALADVPVGGAAAAKTADGKPVIVAQPSAGTVVAYSAVCTHQGCTVAPSGSEIKCPCHGSVFATADGARMSGPAQRPLAAVAVAVVDGQVVPA